MDANTIRTLLQSGGINRAVIYPYPLIDDAYTLSVVLQSGEEKGLTKARSTEQKIFRSIDALGKEAKRIGLKQALINF